MSNNPTVKCPSCRQVGKWFEGELGPFCSRRCQLVDLGRWFDEAHVIEAELRPDMFDGYEDLPPGEYLDRPEG